MDFRLLYTEQPNRLNHEEDVAMTNNKPTAPTQAAGCGVSRPELLLGAGAVLAGGRGFGGSGHRWTRS